MKYDLDRDFTRPTLSDLVELLVSSTDMVYHFYITDALTSLWNVQVISHAPISIICGIIAMVLRQFSFVCMREDIHCHAKPGDIPC